jgi:hypothetical protein
VTWAEIKANRERAISAALAAVGDEITGTHITIERAYLSSDRPFRVSDYRMYRGAKHYSFASLENAIAKARLLAADSRRQRGEA